MACAAFTSNRSALFLFVKINILSLSRCTHRGMGHEPLLRFRGFCLSASGVGKGLHRLLASCARLAVRWLWLVEFSDGLGSGSVSALAFGRAVGHFSCGWPCFGFGLRPCFGQGSPVRGHWPVATAIARTNVRWRKTKHPTFGAFTKPKNLI